MAAIDGHIDPDEVLVVKEFVRTVFTLDDAMLGQTIALFNEARKSSRSASFYARRLAKFHGSNRRVMAAIVNLLRDVALSDGQFAEAERSSLEGLARILGVAGNSESSKTRSRHQSPRASQPGEEKTHGGTLGLKGKVTIEMIRQAYRKLVLQHHPDKHHHATPAAKREAHDRMVEINAAYAYFRERYDF